MTVRSCEGCDKESYDTCAKYRRIMNKETTDNKGGEHEQ